MSWDIICQHRLSYLQTLHSLRRAAAEIKYKLQIPRLRVSEAYRTQDLDALQPAASTALGAITWRTTEFISTWNSLVASVKVPGGCRSAFCVCESLAIGVATKSPSVRPGCPLPSVSDGQCIPRSIRLVYSKMLSISKG